MAFGDEFEREAQDAVGRRAVGPGAARQQQTLGAAHIDFAAWLVQLVAPGPGFEHRLQTFFAEVGVEFVRRQLDRIGLAVKSDDISAGAGQAEHPRRVGAGAPRQGETGIAAGVDDHETMHARRGRPRHRLAAEMFANPQTHRHRLTGQGHEAGRLDPEIVRRCRCADQQAQDPAQQQAEA